MCIVSLYALSPVPYLEDQIVFVSMCENGNGKFFFPCFWVPGMAMLSSPKRGPENELIIKSSMN
ncbi:hypothetical protein C0J52_20755 [Blattella germanica]|nr:hypothetical protein C0J52_20755 [Blattella germanica]